MSRIIVKACNLCGEKYGYMVSGYGVSPSRWNDSKGVDVHCCSKCHGKASDFQVKAWRLRDRVERTARRFGRMIRDPERWLAIESMGDALCKNMTRVRSELITVGKVEVKPMKMPEGGILFWDYKYGEG